MVSAGERDASFAGEGLGSSLSDSDIRQVRSLCGNLAPRFPR